MPTLWLDFETRSRCDLRERGVYNYAQDASTDVLCMSYAFDDEDVRTWLPGQPFPQAVANHKGRIKAHNAAFERLIFLVRPPDRLRAGAVLLHRRPSPRQLRAGVAGGCRPFLWRVDAQGPSRGAAHSVVVDPAD